MAEQRYEGACYCGAVAIALTGEPAAMGYCHCNSCRTWSGGPVNAFTLWKPEQVEVTRGADQIAQVQRSPLTVRKFCRACGGHLMADHPKWGIVDVFASMVPGLAFKPQVHVNYAETVLPMRDGLPKMKDFPKDLGGSGETVPE